MLVVSEYFIMKWPMSWQLLHTLEIMLKDAATRLDPVEAGLPVQPEWATGTVSCYQWQQGPPVLLLSLLVGVYGNFKILHHLVLKFLHLQDSQKT